MKHCLFLLAWITAYSSGRHAIDQTEVKPGAYQLEEYLPKIANKKVALTVNHSSTIGQIHLIDTLKALNIHITKIFTPEHGFTGTASDGAPIEYVKQQQDHEWISLYGKTKKPTPEHLLDVEVMIFDIQDVGVRFYTYISTMHYVMEACAENHIPMIILDRPNPNASYIDGPVLYTRYQSFVGMHPIPIVYGMTIGELAQMINGERWLKDQLQCHLEVIKIKNWNHQSRYSLPVKPSPNLPNALSVSLYPSLCLFEGTIMSVGRGTAHAFQQIGHPNYPYTEHAFTPESQEGAKYPPYENQTCYGKSWIGQPPKHTFSLTPLLEASNIMTTKNFFNPYFTNLSGTERLQKQIEMGVPEKEIRASWKPQLDTFKKRRKKYLLYHD